MRKFWAWVWAAMKWVFKVLGWVIYELTGIRWVWEHVRPPTEEEKKGRRPAPTITIWVVGVYTALFGLASARYEHAVDRVETRAGAVVALLANDNVRSGASAQIARIQDREIPKRPEYGTFFIDSFWKWESYEEGIELLKTAVESCKKELRRANLAEANLAGVDLMGADLTFANLEGTNLEGANLEGANLEETRLWGTNLQRARLGLFGNWDKIGEIQAANITGIRNAPYGFVEWALERGAVFDRDAFKNANLEAANLQDAYLKKVNLEGTKLQGANLQGADLEGANLDRANLNRANLQGAYLKEAYLRRANLNTAKLQRAYLKLANLNEVNLNEANLNGAILVGADLNKADFEGANLNRANLRQANLNKAKLQQAYLRGAYLWQANLENIQNWKEITSIKGANITGVKNAPAGFIEWALEEGAVIDEEPDEDEQDQSETNNKPEKDPDPPTPAEEEDQD